MCMAMTITSAKRWGEVETLWNNKNPHWHILSKSSNIQNEQHYRAFTRGKLFFPRNRKEALDMNYKHWVNFLSAVDNVSPILLSRLHFTQYDGSAISQQPIFCN